MRGTLSLVFLLPLLFGGQASVKAAECDLCGAQTVVIDHERTQFVVETIVTSFMDFGLKTKTIVAHDMDDRFPHAGYLENWCESFKSTKNLSDAIAAIGRLAAHVPIEKIYRSVKCRDYAVGTASLLQFLILRDFGSKVSDVFDKHPIPMNTIHRNGDTELDAVLDIIYHAAWFIEWNEENPQEGMKVRKAQLRQTIRSALGIFKRLRGPDGPLPGHIVPLFACEIRGTCTCPFNLRDFGRECGVFGDPREIPFDSQVLYMPVIVNARSGIGENEPARAAYRADFLSIPTGWKVSDSVWGEITAKGMKWGNRVQ